MRTLLALCCCLALGAHAETFSARVIAVMDGDTLMILRDGKKLKVRLANIDAPEKAQAYGKQSRESLLELVGKRQVRIESRAIDQYGRMIGLIGVDGVDVNQEQVRRGMAWAAEGWRSSRREPTGVPLAGEYSHYHTDKTYIALQSEAQRAHRGLWSQNNPQAPWRWRKSHPSVNSATPVRPQVFSRPSMPVMLYDMECGRKHRCSEMLSCDEARFYFTRCGVKVLDGNHDGEPCENVCDTMQ